MPAITGGDLHDVDFLVLQDLKHVAGLIAVLVLVIPVDNPAKAVKAKANNTVENSTSILILYLEYKFKNIV